MSPILGLLLVLLIVGAVAAVAVSFEYFSFDKRSLRSDTRSIRKELNATRRQLRHARGTLIKIASGDAGHPSLEARLALDKMTEIETNEYKEISE